MTDQPERGERHSRRSRRVVVGARWAAGAAGALAAAWLIQQAGFPAAAAAVAGTTALAAAFAVGLFAVHAALSGRSGITSVARTVVDEAIRMRSPLVLIILLAATLPVLPLLIDPDERLAYRLQFLIGWTLGGAGLMLGLLTIFLACGSICGDIDSGRIHMTLAKPLRRWEYLVGKWLGILLYDLLLVILVGAGSYTLVRMLAVGSAADAADRDAVSRQVLVARRSLPPGPDRPEEYAAAIEAAIAQLERDDPAAVGREPDRVRRRIRHEYERRWHTVTPDMETTFVFSGLGGAAEPGREVQLQVEPRVINVDVDLADVRFAIWLNGRPWPMEEGVHRDVTLPSRSRHVFDLPSDLIGEADTLRVRIANRNLVPPGETRPTAITFPPGDGMQVYVRAGSFEGNLLRCLVLMWAKLALVAAVAVAAAAVFDLPSAILATLVFYATALGSEFFQDALGIYNVVGESGWERAASRIGFAAGFFQAGRFYEGFRMLLGFLADGVLAVLPSFAADAAISRLATGMMIPLRDVLWRLVLFVGLYPAVVGLLGWTIFDRRDLIRSSS